MKYPKLAYGLTLSFLTGMGLWARAAAPDYGLTTRNIEYQTLYEITASTDLCATMTAEPYVYTLTEQVLVSTLREFPCKNEMYLLVVGVNPPSKKPFFLKKKDVLFLGH
jgi:hypothetical protein